jgi:hypothetical protein
VKDRLGRAARTIASLHPAQILARPWSLLAPHVAARWPSSQTPPLLRTTALRDDVAASVIARVAEAENARYQARRRRLSSGSRLALFEAAYGLSLGDGTHGVPTFQSAEASVAFAASVRARRLAVAAALGARDPSIPTELARAVRAILIGVEVNQLGNHLIENAIGLGCAVRVAPSNDAARLVSKSIFALQLDAQFLTDGGHEERSVSYHLALTHALLELWWLRGGVDDADSSGISRVLERALDFCAAVRAPDGSYPLFNDAALDAAPTIEDVLHLARALGFETRAREASKQGILTEVLEATGWVVARGEGVFFALDVGPDGARYQPGHAHADALGFELWTSGARAIADYGVGTYEAGAAREATRATRSHNTVTLGDRDSCEVWGAFRVGRRAHAALRSVDARRDGLTVEASHAGYAWLPGAPTHTRHVELGPRSLLVHDAMPGAREAFTSRLRLTEHGARTFTIEGSTHVTSRQDVWHARHGDPLPATVLEQRAAPGESVRWLLRW